MLWRERYDPVVIRDPSLRLEIKGPCFVLGCPSDADLGDLALWLRLREGEGLPSDELILCFPNDNVESSARAFLPPSQLARTSVLKIEKWPERTFCALLDHDKSLLMVVGPPTEDVWEEVCTTWATIRSYAETRSPAPEPGE